MAEATVTINWAFSLRRQSTYATITPDGDLTQSHPFEGADIADHVPNMSDNAAMFGKGHEFATRNAILSWDVMFKRTFQATSKMLGWAFAFHTGTDGVTGPTDSAYTHVMSYQNPDGAGYYGSGRQLPVTTIVEKVTSGIVRKFPSCLVKAVEVTGTLGDWVKLTMELQGSGKKVDVTPVSGFTFPASSEGSLLRHADLVFTHGVSGALADVSCTVRSFRFRTEYALFDQDGYCPGSGYQTLGDATSGQVRSKLEFGRRACLLEFVLAADSSTTLFTRLTAGTRLAALLTLTGGLIGVTAAHKLIINVPQLQYRAVQIGTDGDQVVWAVSTVIFYDTGLANPFQITVVNDTPAYLASS